MQKVFHFVLTHAIWVAICSAALVFQSFLLLQVQVNSYLVAFVFFATLCSYNFHYLLGSISSFQSFWPSILYRHATLLIMMLTGACGTIVFLSLSKISALQVAVAFSLTFLYSLPLVPIKAFHLLRKAGFVKTVLLAFTWMYVTAYLPLAQYQMEYSTAGILLMTKRFLFMLMLCIIFDNRDVGVDMVRGLHSLATDLSPAMVKRIIGVIFFFLFLINMLLGQHGISIKQVIALQVSAIINLIVYYYAKRRQGYVFYYFIVDGMMVLMSLLTTVASI